MSARRQPRAPHRATDELPGLSTTSPWDSSRLVFGGQVDFRTGLLGLGNQFADQPDLAPDFSLLHGASPTSPSVYLQSCPAPPPAPGVSALTQGLRAWGNGSFDSAAVTSAMDLSTDLMASCSGIDSEPFNHLSLVGPGAEAPTSIASSEPPSSNSSVGSIAIPQHGRQALSDYSFCSEPSLGYTGSSFNSDRSFDMSYTTHKQGQSRPSPQQSAPPIGPSSNPGWNPPPQLPRPAHAQRPRRLTSSQPRRVSSSSVGPNTTKNSLNFIHFRPSGEPGQHLIHGAEQSLMGNKPRGRKNPLTPSQKKEAALMRRVKACESCRQRKEKCDPGIPCKACIDHFRTDLVRQPCRGKNLEDLTSSMLSDELVWCPTERTLDTYFGSGAYGISSEVSFVNLMLGFGPPLLQEVRRVIPDQPGRLFHSHLVYQWPIGANEIGLRSCPLQYHHKVFPAILADTANVRNELDQHLSKLVTEERYFRQFPLFDSPLKVLKHVYMFYRDLRDATHRHLLRTALKLLVLVHISDSTKLDPAVPLFSTSRDVGDVRTMTPCFIRGQLGAVIPHLARDLLRDLLNRLEDICLARRCIDWPVVLATLATVCMAVETTQYHATKEPYHAQFDTVAPDQNSFAGLPVPMILESVFYGPEKPEHLAPSHRSFSSTTLDGCSDDDEPTSVLSTMSEEAITRLISFYRICFRGCHCTRLQELDSTSVSLNRRKQDANQDAVSNQFIGSLKASLQSAKSYLLQRKMLDPDALRLMGMKSAKNKSKRADGILDPTGCSLRVAADPQDMSVFFDRLLAKLFLG